MIKKLGNLIPAIVFISLPLLVLYDMTTGQSYCLGVAVGAITMRVIMK